MELVTKWVQPACILLRNFSNFGLCNTKQNLECFNKINVCYYSTDFSATSVKRCYKILGVPNDSDQETVRQAFVKLVKKFHPDSGSPEADANKFQEIETAYRQLQDKFSHDRWKHNECLGEYGLYYVEKNAAISNVREQDIEHTAPQHRQYLSYDGYGSGTPAQREKQYRKVRAETASNNINSYRVKKIQSETECTEEQALIFKDKKEARKIKTRYGFDRLVEDLIQESMARGEFDNLSGQGKPLGHQYDHYNPYVDLVTHKLNQVLIDNGFKPEWIMLEKEIKDESDKIRGQLAKFRKNLGHVPLNEEDELNWQHTVLCINTDVKRLNSKIGKYNLVVPLLRMQMLQFDLEKEAEKILREGESKKNEINCEENVKQKSNKSKSSIFDVFFSMFS